MEHLSAEEYEQYYGWMDGVSFYKLLSRFFSDSKLKVLFLCPGTKNSETLKAVLFLEIKKKQICTFLINNNKMF